MNAKNMNVSLCALRSFCNDETSIQIIMIEIVAFHGANFLNMMPCYSVPLKNNIYTNFEFYKIWKGFSIVNVLQISIFKCSLCVWYESTDTFKVGLCVSS